ncbi:MAG: hypothetical protein HZB70_02060 [Candidatus Berkelbacteria bacterium]|nr:MAG: hypothetical protein HZB70_02060 [Candidatus Berkelbacteria bacterium]QQG51894.1 MAG: hypothetical protein HY845_00935 [Candidatus Berkelbacteria bacterium]
MRSENKILAVVGPTGSGKTNLGVRLAKVFDGVILSADSRQVYKGLDVGTNKEGEPGRWQNQPARIIEGVPQLLVDIVEPETPFTLNDWLEQAEDAVKLIWSHEKLPIIVGGTGLYVTALLEGYEPGAGRFSKRRRSNSFDSLILQPDVDRETLYQKSDERFERIFDGLLDETRTTLSQGVSHEWLEKLGLDYRFASFYLRQKMNRQIAIEEFQKSSRHYIRRQLTWWRHHGDIQFVKNEVEAEILVKKWLSYKNRRPKSPGPSPRLLR